MGDFTILAIGVICAGIGGELFVRGIVGLAKWARISAGVIGATFAAFATSSPELSVAITSARAGTPEIALGDALGSNVVNIGLILGIALLFAPINLPRDVAKRDFSVALLTPVLLALLALDGELSTIDGAILLVFFAAWMTFMVIEAKKQRSLAQEILGEAKHGRAFIESVCGLAFLAASGKLIVQGATGVAVANGVDPFVVGSTLVAFGTSAPELATVVTSRIKGHDEVGLGTILGSNIFNGLFIVGVASVIRPITVNVREVAVGLAFGLLVTLFVLPFGSTLLERRRGIVIIILYVVYVFTTIQVSG